MAALVLTMIDDGPGQVFVYAGTPTRTSLVASHCPAGPGRDLFGTACPAGDWCAEGWELVPMVRVWPGMLLRQVPPPPG
jgi:hypothetical protein